MNVFNIYLYLFIFCSMLLIISFLIGNKLNTPQNNIEPFTSKEIINESNNVIIVCDKNNTIVSANDKAKNILGRNIINSEIDSQFNPDNNIISISTKNNEYYFKIMKNNINLNEKVNIVYQLHNITDIVNRENELRIYQKIINRVLRHNVRNDMNVIMGYAVNLKENVSEEYKDDAELINDKTLKLNNTFKKLRKIKLIINKNSQIKIDIYEELEKVIENKNYESQININLLTLGENYHVKVNPYIKYAVEEIIENAIEHNKSDNKNLDIILKEQIDTIEIYFQDNGIGIKNNQIDFLDSWDETPHEHGDGGGLWLINWIIKYSNGDVFFNSDNNGSEVKLVLNKKSKFKWVGDT